MCAQDETEGAWCLRTWAMLQAESLGSDAPTPDQLDVLCDSGCSAALFALAGPALPPRALACSTQASSAEAAWEAAWCWPQLNLTQREDSMMESEESRRMRVEEETALLCGGCGELMLWLRSEPMDEYDESYNEDEMMMTRRLETPLKGRRDHGLVRPMSEERMREQQRQAELARECAVDSQGSFCRLQRPVNASMLLDMPPDADAIQSLCGGECSAPLFAMLQAEMQMLPPRDLACAPAPGDSLCLTDFLAMEGEEEGEGGQETEGELELMCACRGLYAWLQEQVAAEFENGGPDDNGEFGPPPMNSHNDDNNEHYAGDEYYWMEEAEADLRCARDSSGAFCVSTILSLLPPPGSQEEEEGLVSKAQLDLMCDVDCGHVFLGLEALESGGPPPRPNARAQVSAAAMCAKDNRGEYCVDLVLEGAEDMNEMKAMACRSGCAWLALQELGMVPLGSDQTLLCARNSSGSLCLLSAPEDLAVLAEPFDDLEELCAPAAADCLHSWYAWWIHDGMGMSDNVRLDSEALCRRRTDDQTFCLEQSGSDMGSMLGGDGPPSEASLEAICGGGCNAASLLWLATADPNSEEGVGLSAIADFYCLRDEQQRFCALTMPMDTGNPDYSGGPGGSHSGGSFGWYSGSNGLVFGPDGVRPGGGSGGGGGGGGGSVAQGFGRRAARVAVQSAGLSLVPTACPSPQSP